MIGIVLLVTASVALALRTTSDDRVALSCETAIVLLALTAERAWRRRVPLRVTPEEVVYGRLRLPRAALAIERKAWISAGRIGSALVLRAGGNAVVVGAREPEPALETDAVVAEVDLVLDRDEIGRLASALGVVDERASGPTYRVAAARPAPEPPRQIWLSSEASTSLWPILIVNALIVPIAHASIPLAFALAAVLVFASSSWRPRARFRRLHFHEDRIALAIDGAIVWDVALARCRRRIDRDRDRDVLELRPSAEHALYLSVGPTRQWAGERGLRAIVSSSDFAWLLERLALTAPEPALPKTRVGEDGIVDADERARLATRQRTPR